MLFKNFALKNQDFVADITLTSVHEIFNLLKPSVYFMPRLVQHSNNSTFCPHSAFRCFVRISEKTANFVVYSTN